MLNKRVYSNDLLGFFAFTFNSYILKQISICENKNVPVYNKVSGNFLQSELGNILILHVFFL